MVKLFDEEKKMSPRLSMAFAAVMLGKRELSELSPLQYLVNTLNSYSWRGIAYPFLVELCREQDIREALYPVMHQRTKEEKIWLADVLARTYAADARPALEKLSQDGETEVAQAGARAIGVEAVRSWSVSRKREECPTLLSSASADRRGL